MCLNVQAENTDTVATCIALIVMLSAPVIHNALLGIHSPQLHCCLVPFHVPLGRQVLTGYVPCRSDGLIPQLKQWCIAVEPIPVPV